MPKRDDANAARKVRQYREHPRRPGRDGEERGTLLIVGGHEDKTGEQIILRELVRQADDARIAVCTVASEEPEPTWAEYDSVFRALGARPVWLDVRERTDGESPELMRTLDGVRAVFFTGGDQLRITSQIGDTPIFSRMVDIYRQGGCIAGTSAGAACMSETMIVGGSAEHSEKVQPAIRLAPGLGFARDMVIDQHFAERGRISRLLAVLAQNPKVLGVGIDENTAILVEDDDRFRVLGEGAVYVLDGSTLRYSNVTEESDDRSLSLVGVTLHVLTQSDEMDLETRTPTPRPAEVIDEELGVDDGRGD